MTDANRDQRGTRQQVLSPVDLQRAVEIERLHQQHPAKQGARFNIIVTVIEVAGAIGLFQLARHLGASDVAAYLIGSIAPCVGALAVWLRARTWSGASTAIFAFTILSAVVALIGSRTPKVLLYKDCAATAVIGLVFAGSCLIGKPVVFYFAQRYGTDGTHDGMKVFDMMWDTFPRFRTGMYGISLIWGGLFLLQAGVTALIIAVTPFDTGYLWDQILPFVAIGLGIVASGAIGRRMQAQGAAAREAALAATDNCGGAGPAPAAG